MTVLGPSGVFLKQEPTYRLWQEQRSRKQHTFGVTVLSEGYLNCVLTFKMCIDTITILQSRTQKSRTFLRCTAVLWGLICRRSGRNWRAFLPAQPRLHLLGPELGASSTVAAHSLAWRLDMELQPLKC